MPDTADLIVMSLLAEGRITAEQASALLADQDAGRGATPGAGPVAVLGAAVRMPGARDLDELWSRLTESASLVGPLPTRRFDLVAGASPELAGEFGHLRGKLDADNRSFGGWIDDIEQFDPEAFGLSAFEAGFMGPAERLLLQVTDEALALSGIRPEELRGSRTGVFGAYQPNTGFEYLRLFDDPDERAFISSIPANVLYRLAYTHDLRGPVLGVDTTCSSSLAALHLARRALQAGECDLAIVASVSLNLFPFWNGESDHFVKSPRHRCASYDAGADGIAWGEGVITVVLKRAEDAARDHDCVTALVTGSAITSDGASNGMPAPNPDAHHDAVRAALTEAGVSAARIGYVEGHGAGTVLGDATELDALTRAFRVDTDARGFCRLGSVKAVAGHLGDSAGLAGFLEALLCLRKQGFPGLAGLTRPNPALAGGDSPFVVSGSGAPWPAPSDGDRRRAGVSSLGISGTNVHVIVEEPAEPRPSAATTDRTPVLLSARTRWALWELVRRLAESLDEDAAVHDVAYTLARRGTGPARLGVFASDTAELLGKLRQLLSVRTFERIPEHLGDQHVFPADSEGAVEYSVRKLGTVDWTGVEPADIALMTAYVKGAEDPGACLRRLEPGRTLPLPVAPLTTRRIWPGATDQSVDVSRLFFRPEWVEARPVAVGTPAGGTWIVLAHAGDEEARAVADRLRGSGSTVRLVTAADGFARIGSHHFGIDVDSAQDYDRLWRAVGTLEELSGIVHMLGRGSGEDPMATARALETSQRDGVFSLFRLGQSLIRLGRTEPLLVAVVAARAHQVAADEHCEPSRVTGFGFLRVLSQEVPSIAELAIDHDFRGSPAEIAAQIVAEVAAGPRERLPLVAYRDGRRFTKVVNRNPEEGGGTPLTVRPGGTYVLAGGTGYLGMQVGRFLAEHGAGSIVLLSRRGLPPRETWGTGAAEGSTGSSYTFDAIRQMEESGASVRIMACDITDESAVRRTFDGIRSELGPIHGAFMLAKELFHLWIGDLDFDRFRSGIENRVLGTWLLAEELRRDRPDFLVLFSSVSSLTGTKGAAECAAVNQYLDAVAPRLTASGVPAYTVNLPLILDDKSGFAASTPIPPIDFAQFRASLERFFRDAHQVDIVTQLDLAEVHYLREVLRIPFGAEVWREAAEHAAPDAADTGAGCEQLSGAQIEHALGEAWRATLGRAVAAPDENFFTAGGTSLSAVRLVHLVGKAMPGIGFDVAALYGNATFAAQIDYCTRRLQAATPVPADDLETILLRVQRGELSDSEAARLLSEAPAANTGAAS